MSIKKLYEFSKELAPEVIALCEGSICAMNMCSNLKYELISMLCNRRSKMLTLCPRFCTFGIISVLLTNSKLFKDIYMLCLCAKDSKSSKVENCQNKAREKLKISDDLHGLPCLCTLWSTCCFELAFAVGSCQYKGAVFGASFKWSS